MDSSMGKGLDALEALADVARGGEGMASLSALAARMGRERSQLSRSLDAMVAEGFAVKRPRAVALSWRLFGEGQDLVQHRLRTVGQTALEHVAAETGESAYLGVLVGDATVTIAERVPPGSRQLGSWIGRPYPAYCSDCGQALLLDADEDEVSAVLSRTSFVKHGPNTPADLADFLRRLEQSRRRGYSIVDEEAEPGLYSVAAPVKDFRGEIIAALQVVGPVERLKPVTATLAEVSLRWAAWLEGALGGGPVDAEAGDSSD